MSESRWAGGSHAPQDLGRAVHPLSIMGDRFCHHITTRASRFSDLPTSLSFGRELSRGDRRLSVQRAGGLAIILWNLSCHQFSLIKIGLLPARLYYIVAHIVNPVSYLNSVLMLVSQNYNLKFTFNFSFETEIIDWPKKNGRFEMTFFFLGRFFFNVN